LRVQRRGAPLAQTVKSTRTICSCLWFDVTVIARDLILSTFFPFWVPEYSDEVPLLSAVWWPLWGFRFHVGFCKSSSYGRLSACNWHLELGHWKTEKERGGKKPWWWTIYSPSPSWTRDPVHSYCP
jgi:hypothetical protein